MQDWANSAYSMAITTAILPIFFKDVVAKGLPDHISTAYWGYGNSLSTLFISLLAPLLGALADYKGYKKKLFSVFLVLGVVSTALLSTVGEGEWLKCIIIYSITAIGFSGSNIFYDAFLIDITEEKRMDKVSSFGFAFGYLGSTIPFIISIVFILNPTIIGLSSSLTATKLAFFITALWWLVFSIPMLKNVKQKYFIASTAHPIKESLSRLTKTFGSSRLGVLSLLILFMVGGFTLLKVKVPVI